jgi:hypothetical protein
MCGCASRTVVVESFRKHWNPMRPTGSLNPGNLRRIAGNLARRDCKPLPFLAQESIHQERSCSHCYSSATLELLINVQPHVPCDHLSPLLWKKKTHTPAAVNSRILPVVRMHLGHGGDDAKCAVWKRNKSCWSDLRTSIRTGVCPWVWIKKCLPSSLTCIFYAPSVTLILATASKNSTANHYTFHTTIQFQRMHPLNELLLR